MRIVSPAPHYRWVGNLPENSALKMSFSTPIAFGISNAFFKIPEPLGATFRFIGFFYLTTGRSLQPMLSTRGDHHDSYLSQVFIGSDRMGHERYHSIGVDTCRYVPPTIFTVFDVPVLQKGLDQGSCQNRVFNLKLA